MRAASPRRSFGDHLGEDGIIGPINADRKAVAEIFKAHRSKEGGQYGKIGAGGLADVEREPRLGREVGSRFLTIDGRISARQGGDPSGVELTPSLADTRLNSLA